MVIIPAHVEELVTNCEGLGKQKGTKEGSIDKAFSLVWKSDKQVEEVFSLGS